jgi:hypothetical protein
VEQRKRPYGEQVRIAHPKKIPMREIHRLALMADVEWKTVWRALRGEPLLVPTAQRVFQVLLDEKVISERDLGEGVVTE